jgi:hypothetical protein
MVYQEIDADYITKSQLIRLLKKKFGNGFSITVSYTILVHYDADRL